MKIKIKELRVSIDLLARLTKELKPFKFIDLNEIPDGLSVNEYLDINRTKSPYIFAGGKTNNMNLLYHYKEIEKAVDSLYLAKAWLGKMLGELGSDAPYANDGKRKTKEDIEPVSDVDKKEVVIGGEKYFYKKSDIISKQWFEDGVSHIEKVDWIREEIETIIKDVSKWYTHTQTPTREFSVARTNAYTHLREARFWLGFELQRIKENENN